jgi:hypothetical protein
MTEVFARALSARRAVDCALQSGRNTTRDIRCRALAWRQRTRAPVARVLLFDIVNVQILPAAPPALARFR